MADNFLFALLALIPALLNIGIVAYIYLRLARSSVTDIFTLFVIALICWQAEDTLVRLCQDAATARYWDSILSIGWIGLGPLAFHFACRYTGLSLRREVVTLIYAVFVVGYLLYHAFPQPTVFRYYPGWGWVNTPRAGAPDGVIRYAISAIVIAALVLLFRYAIRVRHDRRKRTQAFFIAFGMLVPTVQGVVTQVIFPVMLERPEIPVTSSFLTVFSVSTIVAISRFQLFDFGRAVGVDRLLAQLNSIVLVLSPEGRLLYSNPFAQQLLDLPAEGAPVFPETRHFMSSAADADFRRLLLDPCLSGAGSHTTTTVLRGKGGEAVHLLAAAAPVWNNHQLQGVLLLGTDITEREQALEQLQSTNERLDLISRATNDMVWDWDLGCDRVYRNPEGWRKLFGTLPDDTRGSHEQWMQLVHPDDRDRYGDLRRRLQEDASMNVFDVECRLVRPDGTVAYIADRGYVVRDVNGKVQRLLGATQDITRRRLSELALQQEQKMKQRALTKATIQAQEAERKHIGLELHDNISQILASAALYSSIGRSDPQHNPLLQRSEELIQSAIHEVRKLSHALVPPAEGNETIAEALGRLLEDVRIGSGLDVICTVSDECLPLVQSTLQLTIYRIVQEQCNNIIKYARARRVEVRLVSNAKSLVLHISDDGVGFDMRKSRSGLGLLNMRTRAELHDGEVHVFSKPGEGCRLTAEFPMAARPVPANTRENA
ncbi:MAG: PAS domain S-box protein [Chitinophagaceae bacterium]|nr:MAG: PAS domain S-box protein [Chitinophagaceae bacterium]